MVFAIDGSQTPDKAQFTYIKDIVKDAIKKLHISPMDTHVAVVEYSTEPKVHIYLNDTFNMDDLARRIDLITPSLERSAFADKALEEIRTNVFNAAKGGRPGAANTVVILSDGDSRGEQALKDATEKLKKDGVRLYVVPVGGSVVPDGITHVAGVPDDVFPAVDPAISPDVGDKVGEKAKEDARKGW